MKVIRKLLKKHKWKDLILIYKKLKERYSYTRSYGRLKRLISKFRSAKAKKKEKYKEKPYTHIVHIYF